MKKVGDVDGDSITRKGVVKRRFLQVIFYGDPTRCIVGHMYSLGLNPRLEARLRGVGGAAMCGIEGNFCFHRDGARMERVQGLEMV